MDKKFKILLATDYSKSVTGAEHYAVQFSKFTGSELNMIHVFELPIGDASLSLNAEEIRSDIRIAETKKIYSHRSKLFRSYNLSPLDLKSTTIVREGNASDIIVEEAINTGSDFIIIGTHGATGFAGRVFGSHTWNIIRKAGIPVIVVPYDIYFTDWKNIVFATDYKEGEIHVINFLSQLAKMFDSKLTILHVVTPVLSNVIDRTASDFFMNEIKKTVKYQNVSFKIVNNKEIISGINNYCADKNIDLLVLSPERRPLFEKLFSSAPGITKRIAYQATVPLMTIPDLYNPINNIFWKDVERGIDVIKQEY